MVSGVRGPPIEFNGRRPNTRLWCFESKAGCRPVSGPKYVKRGFTDSLARFHY